MLPDLKSTCYWIKRICSGSRTKNFKRPEPGSSVLEFQGSKQKAKNLKAPRSAIKKKITHKGISMALDLSRANVSSIMTKLFSVYISVLS